MAAIPFPSGVVFTDVNFALRPTGGVVPSQIATAPHVVSYGPGVWTGTHVAAPVRFSRRDQAGLMEAFMDSMSNGLNTTELPLMRPTIEPALGVLTTGSVLVADVMATTFSAELDVKAGEFIRLGSRVYRNTREVGEGFILAPQRPVDAGLAVQPATTIRVSMLGTGVSLPRRRSLWGPWTINWIENQS